MAENLVLGGGNTVRNGKLAAQLQTDESPPLTGVTSTVDGPSNPQLDHYIERG